jgi:AraC-like DNA-binding protein
MGRANNCRAMEKTTRPRIDISYKKPIAVLPRNHATPYAVDKDVEREFSTVELDASGCEMAALPNCADVAANSSTGVDRLRRSPKGRRAIAAALDAFGPYGTGASVRDVAREVGLCQRRFRKVFAAQVGLTPKIFCRILRFQRVRTIAEQIEKPDWAQIASTCGYFDQSHLINDFQEFSGFSPTEYLHRLRKHQHDSRLKSHHVPLTG